VELMTGPATADPAPSGASDRTQGPTPSLARILVTDDRPEMLHTINRSLGETYACEFARNVEEAREKLAAGTYELALCDVHAAGELGLALTEEIIEDHPGTAVVLVTREEDPEIARQAFALGVHGYLVEPLQPGQLLITVTSALRQRNLERTAKELRLNLERRFQTIIDMAPIPIYAKDISHQYIVANAKADELAGLKRGRLVGRADASILSPGATEAKSGVEGRVLDGGSTYDAEESMTVDGVERTYKTVKFPLVDAESRITAVCGISIDITAEKDAMRLRDELGTAQERAIEELRLSRVETAERLAKAIELHDSSTGEHVYRMAVIASFLARRLGLTADHVQLLRAAAPMHDVGKIGTSADILRKPGRLNPEEREEMERHTVIGHEILSNSESKLLRTASVIALTHHERFDGTGYPHGLAGKEIPLDGRITAVADVFDALLSDRCYRPAMSVTDAVALMAEGRGTQFDPEVVDVLLANLDEALALRC
jgi:putative two-component system response regulator